MARHIDDQGQFRSDRHPDLGPDKIALSFKDIRARRALTALAEDYTSHDPDFASDIFRRLLTISGAGAADPKR